MPRKKIDLEAVRQLALGLADVEESSSSRGIGWKVHGKLFACQAIHKSAEPNSLMVRVSQELRADLLAEDPDSYYLTDHYRDYDAVLVRLSRIRGDSLRGLLKFARQFVSTRAGKTRRQ